MEFICIHCEKLINCLPRVVDKEILHTTCEEQYRRDKIYAKWKPLFEEGHLLHGLNPDNYKPGIADFLL